MLNKDNELIELTPEQQNPGAAKAEDFIVGENIPARAITVRRRQNAVGS